MILSSWCKLVFTSTGKISGNCKFGRFFNTIQCDTCSVIFDERFNLTDTSIEKYGKSLCGKCRTPLGASHGGKMSQIKCPNNKGRFTSKRWNDMTLEQQTLQVTRANAALQHKLNTDPEYKDNHYKKIFQNSKIGFISKGHNELHEFLKEYGFVQHCIIGNMEVDECHIDLKIVVEYNGDLYHCNPRKWKPDQYNSAIKMTSSEKWEKDRNRTNSLYQRGYIVFVVWEEDWKLNRDLIKSRLLTFIENRQNEIIENRKDS